MRMRKVQTTRELWCTRGGAVYPSAEVAARTTLELLDDIWGDRNELSGPPPSEIRVQVRSDHRFPIQAPSGLVEVVRKQLDRWEAGSLEVLRSRAWQFQASLDDCLTVKAFGRVSNHAKEISWLLTAVEKFCANGGTLKKAVEEIKVGYTILRSISTRDATEGRSQRARAGGG